MKKILLIGDSIRLGYDKYVKMAFAGAAEVYYPEENSRFAAYVLRNLPDWKAQLKCGDDVDLVHWNAGLWDVLTLLDGERLTPIAVYEFYLERICKLIQHLLPKAQMIFATSTPFREELFSGYKRYNKDIVAYNDAAAAIVKRYGGEINDLYALAEGAPGEWHSDMPHYYTKEGTRMLTDQVIRSIETALDIQSKPLDYDALFAATKDALGI